MTIEEFKCEHGFGPEYRGPSGTMLAPYSFCTCCGTVFFYVDSGMWSSGGSSGTSWEPKDRCAECGGAYQSWSIPAPVKDY